MTMLVDPLLEIKRSPDSHKSILTLTADIAKKKLSGENFGNRFAGVRVLLRVVKAQIFAHCGGDLVLINGLRIFPFAACGGVGRDKSHPNVTRFRDVFAVTVPVVFG